MRMNIQPSTVAGMFITYLYVIIGTKPICLPLLPAAYVLMVVMAFLSVIAIINPGRSFGIVPANRGIKTRGFYAVVRHPIYTLYMLHDIRWNLHCSSVHNCCVFVLYCLITYSRAKREERILRHDPAY